MSKASSLADDFRPIMPPLIRLLVGIIVLVVTQSIILGFPGISQFLPSTSLTIASTVIFTLGLFVSVIVLKYGTQLANAIGEAYRDFKNYVPLAAFFFQIAALYILYKVGQGPVSSTNIFASAPWAYSLIFLLVALVPTIKVVIKMVGAFEGRNTTRRVLSN